jgi:predicted DNA-binding transcriptional regulator YafY
MRPLDLVQLLRQFRTLRSADLLARLQKDRPTMSRATMMRMVKELGDQIVVGGLHVALRMQHDAQFGEI